jgi:hypothetical protein
LRSLAPGKGYAKQALREDLREFGIRPLTKHRIFEPYGQHTTPESIINATISARRPKT